MYEGKMESTEDVHGSLPAELKERLASFDDSLTQLETSLEPLLSVPRNELCEKLPPLDQAKLDLLSAYALNSMFWMYLNTCGENPKEHGVKQELDRIKTYMGRLKEIQEKVNAPKLDQKASKRFVKSALWQAAHKQADKILPDVGEDKSSKGKSKKQESSDGKSRSRKRKRNKTEET